MIIGGLVAICFGVRAEGQSLENIATPLTAEDSGESGPKQDQDDDGEPAPTG